MSGPRTEVTFNTTALLSHTGNRGFAGQGPEPGGFVWDTELFYLV